MSYIKPWIFFTHLILNVCGVHNYTGNTWRFQQQVEMKKKHDVEPFWTCGLFHIFSSIHLLISHATFEGKSYFSIKMNSSIKKDENHFVVNKLYFFHLFTSPLNILRTHTKVAWFMSNCCADTRIEDKNRKQVKWILKHMRPFYVEFSL